MQGNSNIIYCCWFHTKYLLPLWIPTEPCCRQNASTGSHPTSKRLWTGGLLSIKFRGQFLTLRIFMSVFIVEQFRIAWCIAFAPFASLLNRTTLADIFSLYHSESRTLLGSSHPLWPFNLTEKVRGLGSIRKESQGLDDYCWVSPWTHFRSGVTSCIRIDKLTWQ